MPEALNPYAPPAEIHEIAENPSAIALEKLGGPAIGLIVLSAMTAPGVILIPFLPIAFLVRVFAMHDPPRMQEVFGTTICAIMWISNCFILYGAWKMRSGTSYQWAYRAAVLSCIPVLSASGYLGIPFGIWALIILHRRDVKEAFARNAENQAQKISCHEPPVG